MSSSSRSKTGLAAALIALLAWPPACADEADDQYAVAAGLYARQQWPLAAEAFPEFLARHPHHPMYDQGLFFLGETLVQLGRYDEAGTRFAEYLRRVPAGQFARSALFRTGETCYLGGRRDQARQSLEEFLGRYPEDPLAAYVLAYVGDIALNAGEASQAESYYRRGLEQFPQGPTADDCRFGLARSLDKLGRPEEAEPLYLALAANADVPLADDAQFHLGALQYAAGRFEEAVGTFETFESRFPASSWLATVHLAHGWALWKLDRLAEAGDLFARIAADPKLGVEARYWLGLTRKSQEDWEAAAAEFLKAVEAQPDHELALALRFQAGDALLRGGDAAAARQQFECVITDAPEDSQWLDDALRGAAQASLLAKDHAAVDRYADAFNRRAAGSPLQADVRRILVRSLIEQKKFAGADSVLDSSLLGGGKQPTVEDRYLYALVCRGLGRNDDALSALEAVSKSAEGRLLADAHLARTSLLVDLKRFEEAIEPLEAFLTSDPSGDQVVQAKAQLAVCRARCGQMDKAKQAHRRLLDEHDEHEVLAPAVEQLAEAAYEMGDFDWASELFSWLAEQGPSGGWQARGLSGLAWSQHRAGNRQEAAETFRRLLESEPDASTTAEAALARGRILQELGRFDAALAMYDLAMERLPEGEPLAEAIWAAARLRDELHQDQEAASLYRRLATEFPDFKPFDGLLYNWAWALSDAGQAEESDRAFERILSEHPESDYAADAAFRLAQRSFKAGDCARARQLIEQAPDGKCDAALRENLLYLLGQVFAAEEKWEDAYGTFDTLVADYPQGTLRLMAEYGGAEALFRQGDYAAAGGILEELWRKTLSRDEPWLAVVHLRLAQSLAYQRRWTEAYALASKIEARFPEFSKQYEVDYVIGRCLASQADFDEAREAYGRVIRSPGGEKTETAAKSQLMIAESYFHQKSYDAALREYLRLEILYDYPELQAAAVLQAAKCHERLGQPQQAAGMIRRLRELYPRTAAAAQAARSSGPAVP